MLTTHLMCDICGKEIPHSARHVFKLAIRDMNQPRVSIDMCEDCYENLYNYLTANCKTSQGITDNKYRTFNDDE